MSIYLKKRPTSAPFSSLEQLQPDGADGLPFDNAHPDMLGDSTNASESNGDDSSNPYTAHKPTSAASSRSSLSHGWGGCVEVGFGVDCISKLARALEAIFSSVKREGPNGFEMSPQK